MTKKKKPAASKTTAENSGKGSKATQFQPGNPWRFKQGQSGNPGGRPKALGEAARKVLASKVPPEMMSKNKKLAAVLEAYAGEKEPELTWAEHIALTHALRAAAGDTDSTRELRVMSEGTKVTSGWQAEIIEHLRVGTLTPEEVLADLGDELARPLLIAAGFSREEGGETSTKGE